jgi:hypothetical protein
MRTQIPAFLRGRADENAPLSVGSDRLPPVFAGRHGRVYVVEVWVKTRPTNPHELEEAAGVPVEFAEVEAQPKPPALSLDDL